MCSFLEAWTRKAWAREALSVWGKGLCREVEHCCITPLVFSTTAGMRKATTVMSIFSFFCPPSQNIPLVIGWLCCSWNFSLLKSWAEFLLSFYQTLFSRPHTIGEKRLSIMCIHGFRSHPGFSLKGFSAKQKKQWDILNHCAFDMNMGHKHSIKIQDGIPAWNWLL